MATTVIPEEPKHLGISVLASASLAQTKAFGQIPDALISRFSHLKLTPAQQALQFTRSCPGVLAALVGMKNPAHVASNLALNRIFDENFASYF